MMKNQSKLNHIRLQCIRTTYYKYKVITLFYTLYFVKSISVRDKYSHITSTTFSHMDAHSIYISIESYSSPNHGCNG